MQRCERRVNRCDLSDLFSSQFFLLLPLLLFPFFSPAPRATCRLTYMAVVHPLVPVLCSLVLSVVFTPSFAFCALVPACVVPRLCSPTFFGFQFVRSLSSLAHSSSVSFFSSSLRVRCFPPLLRHENKYVRRYNAFFSFLSLSVCAPSMPISVARCCGWGSALSQVHLLRLPPFLFLFCFRFATITTFPPQSHFSPFAPLPALRDFIFPFLWLSFLLSSTSPPSR